LNIEDASTVLATSRNPDSKRAIIAIVRRVVFSGLILLFAWLIILAFRGAAPSPPAPFEDWSRSLFYQQPVAEIVAARLGFTVELACLGGIMGLILAAVLLLLGMMFFHWTKQFTWVSPIRTALRCALVNAGATIPIFLMP